MIGHSKKNREKLYEKVLLIKKKKKAGLKFNAGLALTGVRTTYIVGTFKVHELF